MSHIVTHPSANIERFSSVARCYDAYRPEPPVALLDLLTRLSGAEQPKLVVDIGCGTGLSSRVWATRAEEVVGIDPNAHMLEQARARPAAGPAKIRYQQGLSSQTGLADGCADIVTCVQCEQWMEPKSTIDEVIRILRPGGVFAIVGDYDVPMMQWEAVVVYQRYVRKMVKLLAKHKEVAPHSHGPRSTKAEYLSYLHDSNQFRFIKQSLMHSLEQGNSDRLAGLALSLSNTRLLLDHGFTEEEIGLAELRHEAKRTLGNQDSLWYFSFQIILAVK